MEETLDTLADRREELKRKEGGFTLVELLIVIVILGVLSAVVVFAVGGINDKGESAACQSTASSVRTASEAYLAQNDEPAATITALGDLLHLDDVDVATNGLSISVNGHTITYTPSDGSVSDDCNA